MNTTIYKNFAVLAVAALLLSACSGAATPDAAAIATSAVQTVEARYTQQAALDPTQTSTPISTPIATSAATLTPGAQDTPLPTMAPQTPQSNGKPCYAASVQDITVVDGTIEAPGTAFTKTWRLYNLGNCPWDSSYALTFDSGDGMGAVTKIPFTTKVYPGASYDVSVDMTAPATDGIYTGYWRVATPYGGTFGVGTYDQSIFVKITVSSQPRDAFGVSSVAYDYTRKPAAGCDALGATFTVYATVTANGPGVIVYHWDRHPYDGGPLDGGKLRFGAAGSQTVNWTWTLRKAYSIQNIDRWIAFTVDLPVNAAKTFGRVLFNFSC